MNLIREESIDSRASAVVGERCWARERRIKEAFSDRLLFKVALVKQNLGAGQVVARCLKMTPRSQTSSGLVSCQNAGRETWMVRIRLNCPLGWHASQRSLERLILLGYVQLLNWCLTSYLYPNLFNLYETRRIVSVALAGKDFRFEERIFMGTLFRTRERYKLKVY